MAMPFAIHVLHSSRMNRRLVHLLEQIEEENPRLVPVVVVAATTKASRRVVLMDEDDCVFLKRP